MTRLSAKGLIELAATCVECGKEHAYRKVTASSYSWASPKDGHAYRPKIGEMMHGNGSAVLAALRQLAGEVS